MTRGAVGEETVCFSQPLAGYLYESTDRRFAPPLASGDLSMLGRSQAPIICTTFAKLVAKLAPEKAIMPDVAKMKTKSQALIEEKKSRQ